jgi:hypothetical protein
MACAYCDFYIPKDSTAALLLVGTTHLSRLLQEIPLGANLLLRKNKEEGNFSHAHDLLRL